MCAFSIAEVYEHGEDENALLNLGEIQLFRMVFEYATSLLTP